MDNALRAIIERIEQSGLSEEAKAQLYTMISGALQATMWPVLTTYVPKEDLDALEKNPNDKETVQRYTTLIAEAVEHGHALAEIEDAMSALVKEVDAALREEHI